MKQAVILIVVLAGSLAACTVGINRELGGVTGDDDDGVSTQPDAPAGAQELACIDGTTAGPAHVHGAGAGGGTKAGTGCIVNGCHLNGGGGGPAFVFAGTVYKNDGVTPRGGANIRVVVAGGGTPLRAVTDDAGNFNIQAGANGFPASTDASSCPAITPMNGKLNTASDGNCNSAGCHANPGGAAGPIKLGGGGGGGQ
jgi:hypothetical protein